MNAVKKIALRWASRLSKSDGERDGSVLHASHSSSSAEYFTGYPTGAVAVWSASGQYESMFAVGEGLPREVSKMGTAQTLSSSSTQVAM